MTKTTSTLWWVSVGGNQCEPARVVLEGNDRTVFTIGCADGTLLSNTCGIELVEEIDDIPLTPADEAKRRDEWEKKRAEDRARGIHHGYRRFD